jgi:hypothetical protein
MRMKGEVMYVHILGFDLDELIIRPIEEITNKHLFFVFIVDPPREEFDLLLHSLMGRDNNDISIRIQHL